MAAALELAREGLGSSWPNPSVGCMLVKDGQLIAKGQTSKTGRPHAEQNALALAGENAIGSLAYVSLEPCAHVGETSACADLLAGAGIVKCIYALEDPDPRVSGRGGESMRKSGMEVQSGLLEDEARDLNQGFFLRIKKKRPMITLKLATSSDGKIAASAVSAAGGGTKEKWITGRLAREQGHYMRASHDAILVGLGTILADDPTLTCRIPGSENRSPVRIILDSSLKTPVASKLVQTADKVPVWIISEKAANEKASKKYQGMGVKILTVPDCRDLAGVLAHLAEEGLTRLMVEGGAKVSESFLASGFVDHVAWFRAPVELGDDALPALGGKDIALVLRQRGFRRISSEKIGNDVLEKFSATH